MNNLNKSRKISQQKGTKQHAKVEMSKNNKEISYKTE